MSDQAETLIAPCGMNCALCWAYQAQQYDLQTQGINRKYCPGCIPRGEHCLHMRKSCETLGNGLLRFCYEYGKFPCERLKRLDKRYRTKYHMSMIENLQMIRGSGPGCLCERPGNQMELHTVRRTFGLLPQRVVPAL